MSKGKEYIPIFLDFNENTKDLSDEECGRLIRAMFEYANGREYEHLLIGGERIAFPFIKGFIDRNAAISQVRSKAGASKGNKEDQNASNENKTQQTESNALTNTNTKTETKTKTKTKTSDEAFDRFWDAYPRKVAKPDARKKFDKINPDEELLQVMLASIEKWSRSDQWTKDGGQFIPYPSTWLNQRRWEDSVPEPTKIEVSFPVIARTVPAQNYTQRDYSGEQEEALRRMLEGIIA